MGLPLTLLGSASLLEREARHVMAAWAAFVRPRCLRGPCAEGEWELSVAMKRISSPHRPRRRGAGPPQSLGWASQGEGGDHVDDGHGPQRAQGPGSTKEWWTRWPRSMALGAQCYCCPGGSPC